MVVTEVSRCYLPPSVFDRAMRMARATGRHTVHRIDLTQGTEDDDRIVESRGWCFVTKSGQLIRHPGSYKKKGFGNMEYRPAYCHVVLGVPGHVLAKYLADESAPASTTDLQGVLHEYEGD